MIQTPITPMPETLVRILFVGDVVGPLGLTTVESTLPRLRDDHAVDFCVANGENSFDSGVGLDEAGAARLLAAGVDVITTGNHAYDAPGADALLGSDAPIVRPDNLPHDGPGRAGVVVERHGVRLGVVNVIGAREGQAPISACDGAEHEVQRIAELADIVLVDVHGSWPAEKLALAWMLDGRVSAVLGTHTHVPTADDRILPGGTAYVTDAGMTGASDDALIGFEPQDIVGNERVGQPTLPRPVTTGDGVLMAMLVTVGLDGRSTAIERVTARAKARSVRAGARERPAAAIFDCDGLLVDSAASWRAAYERVLQRRGRSLDDELLAQLNGASVTSAATALEVPAAALHDALEEAFETDPVPTPMPGAHALLASLFGRLPIAVATNAPAELATLALRRAGLDRYLDAVVSADGGPGKPAPDVYIAACARLGVAPSHAVALEDSPVGAAAAQAAGLRLIYIPSAPGDDVDADLEARRLDDAAVRDELLGACELFARSVDYASTP
ncbi:YmdB family metallophosphoesterase [Conexibacter stalactiti]|uniref:YmdB family metallophosphoesterase n=1 Tax=Conexibacter stalactiti TaxID=1940611 RepID=A0ABU4HP35_9ACTN|nr:YmdB family metallophosphoesterase [Conexibacter stalactiti]MDW5595061.1 YmdB family metallophosphoesterase [Conexibacter stalactiti]MEC5035703.1 YmdB family metallophosphoesterase [Conexibacter stalactiti]